MADFLIKGVAKRIYDVFGKDAKVYTDKVPQGFSEPCFFVHLISCAQQHIVNWRYLRTYSFDVHYFPKERQAAGELARTASSLLLALEYVKLFGGLLRASSMRYEISDGVLHFFVDYKMFVVKKHGRDAPMQRLVQVQKLKE
jgi:hypothetical protein